MPLLNSRKRHKNSGKIDFTLIASTALSNCASVLRTILPDGRREGPEWVSRNPTRNDKSEGSFRVNMNTGKWADFATDARGGDLISLTAYVNHRSQIDAARWLSERFNFGDL